MARIAGVDLPRNSEIRLPPLDGPGSADRIGTIDDGPDFLGLLEDGVQRVSDLKHDVKTKMQGLVTGETEDVHEVLLAMGKSEVAFQMMLEIRNKLVDAWKELTRIHV